MVDSKIEMNLIPSTFIGRGNPQLQDRGEYLQFETRTMFVVADGSGGTSGAAQAAEFVIRSVRENIAKLSTAENCFSFLYELDGQILKASECGETTAVVVVISRDAIFGANVGDSSAWLFSADSSTELTRIRKPYLGSGVAVPHQFNHKVSGGTLVVGSDGLWKYASLESIERVARTGNSQRLATELSDLARMRSGNFQDDIAIAACTIEI